MQILPDRDLKPQAKHLQTRLEYLLRVLKKHAAELTGPAKPPKVASLISYAVDVFSLVNFSPTVYKYYLGPIVNRPPVGDKAESV